jgi:RNA polymerase sigma-70 factor (ECF subfamily)
VEDRVRRLLAVNGPALLRLAASYTRSVSDRDDLFQEISIAIWRALPQFRADSSERTFIFRIAHNRAISYLTRRRLPVSPAEGADVPDPQPDPEAGLLLEHEHARLAAAIRDLPVEYRQVVTLALEGLTYAEIAQVAGVSRTLATVPRKTRSKSPG